MNFLTFFPAIAAGCAVLMDLRRTKVDNEWILFSLCISLVAQLLGSGPGGAWKWSSGLLVPFLILGWLFAFRMLGAGDIKLLCAIGSMLGPGKILECIALSFLIGAAFSGAILISNGIFCQRFLYLFQYVSDFFQTGERKPYYKSGMPLENFHFTVPIFMSTLLYAGGVY